MGNPETEFDIIRFLMNDFYENTHNEDSITAFTEEEGLKIFDLSTKFRTRTAEIYLGLAAVVLEEYRTKNALTYTTTISDCFNNSIVLYKDRL